VHKITQNLENIVVIIIVTVICNLNTWKDVAFFGDMIFDEDSSSKRAGFAVQNFSFINKITLNLIRSNKDEKIFLFRKLGNCELQF